VKGFWKDTLEVGAMLTATALDSLVKGFFVVLGAVLAWWLTGGAW
jgi:hypothetical protein